ncbi:MAG: acyltransferase [Chitinophagaceae bacterium]
MAQKNHYTLLDGLRGIAAFAVILYHFMEMFIPDYSKNFIAHGFLAVDFFFALSGFVIAYSYDSRILTMRKTTFFRKRLVRLHPLVVAGSILGLIAFLLDPFSDSAGAYTPARLGLIFLMSILVLPFPVMEDRAFNLFGLNAPAWSLFWEYIANIVYGLFLCKLPRKFIVVLSAVFALLLIQIAFKKNDLMGGWGKDSFWDGSVRLGFSFSIGMAVYRYRLAIANRLSFLPLALLLFATFLTPYHKSWNCIMEPFIIIIVNPLILLLSIGSTKAFYLNKTVQLLGNISYPLYMTHYTFIWIFGHYHEKMHPSNGQLLFVITSTIVVMFLLAYFVMKYIDEPVRRYLNKKIGIR